MEQKADKTKDLNKKVYRHKKGKESNSFCLLPLDFLLAKSSAFSLVEILIVVGILGILAAIVMPEYQNHSQQAKEAAAKDNLRILRNVIQIYAAEHNGIAPGYPNNDSSSIPNWMIFVSHLVKSTNQNGAIADPGTSGYNYGPYLSEFPANPFSELKMVKIIANTDEFPETPDENFAWIYKARTKEIRLSKTGTDLSGVSYYDY